MLPSAALGFSPQAGPPFAVVALQSIQGAPLPNDSKL